MKTIPLVLALLMGVTSAHAQTDEAKKNTEMAESAQVSQGLAAAMRSAKISLSRGLRASEKEGRPISGKFEVEDGKLQLSIYTMKGDQFFEVIVDHQTGKIVKAERITEGDDLKAAKSQAEAMAKAKGSLSKLVGKAEKMNPGWLAVGVTPEIENGGLHADLILLKGEESKRVEEKL